MRIGIDVRYLSHGLVGGVHRCITYLIPALLAAGPQHEFFLYADTKKPLELTALPPHATVRLLPYRNALSSVYNDYFMRQTMQQDQLDVVHFPANYGFGPSGTRTVITLHDQINVMPLREIVRGHAKKASTLGMMTYLHFSTVEALRRADMLITISEYSRQEIMRHNSFDPDRIEVVMYSPPPDARRITDAAALEAVRQRYQLDKPFVLADAIKNPGTLVRAWQKLAPDLRQQYQIVFFSRTPEPPAEVFEAEAAGHARLLIRPPYDDLIALFNLARAFVFPSWIEGLGIPIFEAMVCGAPVIASDRGSIPEVAADAGLLADAEDADGFARNITRVLTDPELAAQMQARGFARAAQFTWDETGRRILTCYERALHLPA
jgi:glycosyltransferase involved in cell wall biosynthesis